MTEKPLNCLSTKILVASATSFAVCLFWALPAIAQVDIGMPYAETLGLPDKDIREIAAQLIRIFIGLMGFLLMLIILWSGFKYMTHGGNEEKREEAVAGIKNAVIGLFIMLISFSAARFIIDAIGEATGIM
ncbi:pilin [Patescibacteria group bacterium]|nr:pilin [Patescibacteria group bacterium]